MLLEILIFSDKIVIQTHQKAYKLAFLTIMIFFYNLKEISKPEKMFCSACVNIGNSIKLVSLYKRITFMLRIYEMLVALTRFRQISLSYGLSKVLSNSIIYVFIFTGLIF